MIVLSNGEQLRYIADAAVIVAVVIGVWHLIIARQTQKDDRRVRKEEKEQQKTALLKALATEVETVVRNIEKDFANIDHIRGLKNGARVVSGSRFFIWTPLPDTVIEQATKEIWLIRLSDAEAGDLQELRRRILKANNLIRAKLALLPTLGATPKGEAEDAIDKIDTLIVDQLRDTRENCSKIFRQLKAKN